MSGFPSRITKSQLGSTLRDPRAVEHPEYEWASECIELLKHQAVGAALCCPRVVLCAAWVTDAFVIYYQEEAWNPNGAIAHPVLARESAGVYTYAFAETYVDQGGNAVGFDPHGFRAHTCPISPTHDNGPYPADVLRDSTALVPTLRIILTDSDAVAADVPFWLEVL